MYIYDACTMNFSSPFSKAAGLPPSQLSHPSGGSGDSSCSSEFSNATFNSSGSGSGSVLSTSSSSHNSLLPGPRMLAKCASSSVLEVRRTTLDMRPTPLTIPSSVNELLRSQTFGHGYNEFGPASLTSPAGPLTPMSFTHFTSPAHNTSNVQLAPVGPPPLLNSPISASVSTRTTPALTSSRTAPSLDSWAPPICQNSPASTITSFSVPLCSTALTAQSSGIPSPTPRSPGRFSNLQTNIQKYMNKLVRTDTIPPRAKAASTSDIPTLTACKSVDLVPCPDDDRLSAIPIPPLLAVFPHMHLSARDVPGVSTPRGALSHDGGGDSSAAPSTSSGGAPPLRSTDGSVARSSAPRPMRSGPRVCATPALTLSSPFPIAAAGGGQVPVAHEEMLPDGWTTGAAVLMKPGASNLIACHRVLPVGMVRPIWKLDDYTLLQKVYSGHASSVYKAFCKWSMSIVAIKMYDTTKLHDLSRHQLGREIRLHASLDHRQVIRLHAAFAQGTDTILIQEFANSGDLFSLLVKSGAKLPEGTATELVVRPLLRGIQYLHSKGIVHRDIKLENILFSDGPNMTLKIADFGIAINVREERPVTRAGTLDYMAPEVLRCPMKRFPDDNKARDDLGYSSAVDVWAVGVLTYELLNGCPPFTSYTRQQTEELINTLEPEFVTEISASAENFITSCLAKSPYHRPPIPTLLQHPWVNHPAAAAPYPTHRASAPGNIRNNNHTNNNSSSHNINNNNSSYNIDIAEEPSPAMQHRPAPEKQHGMSSHHNSCTPRSKPTAAAMLPASQSSRQYQYGGNLGAHEMEGQNLYAEQHSKAAATVGGVPVFGKSAGMQHARPGVQALMPLVNHLPFRSVNLN